MTKPRRARLCPATAPDALAALALAATNAPPTGATSAAAHAPSSPVLNGAAAVAPAGAAAPASQRRPAPSKAKVDGAAAVPEFPPPDHPAYRERLQALLSVDNAASAVFWDSPTINTVVGLVRPRHPDGPAAMEPSAAATAAAGGATPVKPDPDDAAVPASPDGSARRSRAGRVIRPPPAYANMTTDLDVALAAHEAGDDYLDGATGGKRRRSSADPTHAEPSGRRNSTGRGAAPGKTLTVGTEPGDVQRLRTWSGALVPVWTAWPPQTSVQVRGCGRPCERCCHTDVDMRAAADAAARRRPQPDLWSDLADGALPGDCNLFEDDGRDGPEIVASLTAYGAARPAATLGAAFSDGALRFSRRHP